MYFPQTSITSITYMKTAFQVVACTVGLLQPIHLGASSFHLHIKHSSTKIQYINDCDIIINCYCMQYEYDIENYIKVSIRLLRSGSIQNHCKNISSRLLITVLCESEHFIQHLVSENSRAELCVVH